ncbi:methylglutaconyl-CoA hydratase, mitochondrial [Diabrotica virgifera virgifera]|uniref:Methylglutaconyl-CoA hydratase, mitochondrial n=1 Tax=Diabrotica virgifera virgifera TaxID=50390 RepID=A0A6P7FZN5_DIAVI|nr:methylglutaconyl-CoA hydratase, mitochondrial [Diabrotica virgifera virgifera]
MNRKVISLFLQTRQYSQKSKEIVVKHLTLEQNGITTIGFNRPHRKNALGGEFVADFHKALDQIAADNVTRVVVLHSLVPKVFCAGADLKERIEMSSNEVYQFGLKLRSMAYKIINLPVPVITAIDGAAMGGGLEIALSSDIRVATSTAKMGLVETSLAIMPGAAGTQTLPRLINPSLAKELIFTAAIFDGTEAKEYGIVNHVVEQNENNDAAFRKALSIAEKILPNGPVGVKMAKKAINKGLEVDLATGLAIEEACYCQLLPTKDRIEALVAFKEKRRPNYIGC